MYIHVVIIEFIINKKLIVKLTLHLSGQVIVANAMYN